MTRKILIPMLLILVVLSACAPAKSSPDVMMKEQTAVPLEEMKQPTEVMMDKPTEVMMDKPTENAEKASDDMMAAPAWLSASLTNVRTGENFMISDFKGKVVLVENMAIWCTTCKKQQTLVKALHETLGMNKDLVSVGLDIDPNENASDLKGYIENNGFDWIYAVAPQEVARELGNVYGAQFLNPPSAPILIIDRKGQVHPMPFGIKSVEDLKTFIDPFLSENM